MYVQTDTSTLTSTRIKAMSTLNQLKEAYNMPLNAPVDPQNRGALIISLLSEIKDNHSHSSKNFIYIGWKGEYLPSLSECESFWLSPRKVMNLEEYSGAVSGRNEDLLKVWTFLFGLHAEIQVSFDPNSGWCSLI